MRLTVRGRHGVDHHSVEEVSQKDGEPTVRSSHMIEKVRSQNALHNSEPLTQMIFLINNLYRSQFIAVSPPPKRILGKTSCGAFHLASNHTMGGSLCKSPQDINVTECLQRIASTSHIRASDPYVAALFQRLHSELFSNLRDNGVTQLAWTEAAYRMECHNISVLPLCSPPAGGSELSPEQRHEWTATCLTRLLDPTLFKVLESAHAQGMWTEGEVPATIADHVNNAKPVPVQAWNFFHARRTHYELPAGFYNVAYMTLTRFADIDPQYRSFDVIQRLLQRHGDAQEDDDEDDAWSRYSPTQFPRFSFDTAHTVNTPQEACLWLKHLKHIPLTFHFRPEALLPCTILELARAQVYNPVLWRSVPYERFTLQDIAELCDVLQSPPYARSHPRSVHTLYTFTACRAFLAADALTQTSVPGLQIWGRCLDLLCRLQTSKAWFRSVYVEVRICPSIGPGLWQGILQAMTRCPAWGENGLALLKEACRAHPSTQLDTVAQGWERYATDLFPFLSDAVKTEAMCYDAIGADGLLLEFVPERFKTLRMCYAATLTNGAAVRFISNDEHFEKLLGRDRRSKKNLHAVEHALESKMP